MESNYEKLLEENRQLKDNILMIQEEIKKLKMKNPIYLIAMQRKTRIIKSKGI